MRRNPTSALVLLVVLCALTPGCQAPRQEEPAATGTVPPPQASLPAAIDSVRVASVDSAAAWAELGIQEADLDGDGNPERLVLRADVALGTDGRPLWEDGHRWALVSESASGRELLYGAFVPNGYPRVAVLSPDAQGRRRVLVEERTAHRLRVLVIAPGAGAAPQVESGGEHDIERWFPDPMTD